MTASVPPTWPLSTKNSEFCARDDFTIATPSFTEALTSKPVKYIAPQVAILERIADLSINNPALLKTLLHVGLAITGNNGKSKNGNDEGSSEQIASLLADALGSHDKDIKEWCSRELAALNEQILRQRANEAHGAMKVLQAEASHILLLVKELLGDRMADGRNFALGLQLSGLEEASKRLQLLLTSSSNVVKAAHDLPDTQLKRCSGYSTAAAVCLTTAGVCLFAPVVPVVGGAAIACGMLSGFAASATGFGITLNKAIHGGKAWTAARQACEEADLNMVSMEKSIKAFCMFFGYVHNIRSAQAQLNTEQYIAQVEQFNEGMPRSIEEWCDPKYIASYIDREGRRLNVNTDKLSECMEALGV